MEREYSSDPGNNEIAFFTGIEVENTPAYGKNTLFVVGLQSVEEVEKHSHNIDHIFSAQIIVLIQKVMMNGLLGNNLYSIS